MTGSISPKLDGTKITHVIVGAGSAGCVLANRLTENRENRVLLIEAGPRDSWWNWKFHMPAALMYNLCNEKYNWFYHTLAQNKMNNRVIYWPRGRVWGGSSTLNAMVYVRGHPFDFDRWHNEGAVDWSYANVLPYFKKSETYNCARRNEVYRGSDGPLQVMRGSCSNPLHQCFIESGKQLGIGVTDDMNGYKQEGTAAMDMTIHEGFRCSSSRAYLWPALNRPNLFTSAGILCTRILFDRNKAIGIEYITKLNFMQTDNIDSYSRNKLYVDDAVILSGGAINSPQLLMVSGVGPADHLRAHEIPIVHHLPGVGENLQDHLEVYVQQKCTKPITLYNRSSWKFPHNMVRTGLQWFISQTGLAASSHLESGGFARSNSEVKHPDIQFHFLPSTVHDDGRVSGSCHGYQLHVGSMRSKSRGYLRLASTDPRRHPLLNPRYLDHEEDLIEFRQCVRISRELFAQKCFDEFRGEEMAPGKDCISDSQMDEFVRNKAASAYHPSCTCKMGSESDRMAVVNPLTMEVHGIKNLHIADASVMPSIISGNLNAATIMVAERAADLIQSKQTLKPEVVSVWTH